MQFIGCLHITQDETPKNLGMAVGYWTSTPNRGTGAIRYYFDAIEQILAEGDDEQGFYHYCRCIKQST